MGILDKLKGLVGGNADTVKDGVDKVGDVVDDQTDGKHTDKIDMATDKIGDMIEDTEAE
jgi:hypothetical protein